MMATILSLVSIVTHAFAKATPTSFAQGDQLETSSYDVAIIGGGVSGTYAAIRLQQLGHSVVVMEKSDRLGGHVNTYVDAKTRESFDFGVTTFDNNSATRDLFSYLGVDAKPYAPGNTTYVDIINGGKILNTLPPSVPWGNSTAIEQAVPAYLTQLAKYPYLSTSGFINLPHPVPVDLLLSTGAWLEKYNLDALAGYIYQLCQGYGNVLAVPVLYTLQCFGNPTGPGPITTAAHDNQDIFSKALVKLGTNVHLNSTTADISRANPAQISLNISTPQGQRSLTAKQLLISVPPTLPNLHQLGLDITPHEAALFRQFNHSYYWDMVLQNTGIPNSAGNVIHIDRKAPLALPSMPGIVQFLAPETEGFTDLVQAYASSPGYLSDEAVKVMVLNDLEEIRRVNGYSVRGPLEFIKFNNHAPYALHVSAEAVKNGFYQGVTGLQGQRRTWYTGAAWYGEDAGGIWQWFEGNVLPRMLAAL